MAAGDVDSMEDSLSKHGMGGGTDLMIVAEYLIRVVSNVMGDRTEFLCYAAIVMNHAYNGGMLMILTLS